MIAHITLFDAQGIAESSGTVVVRRNGRHSLGSWVWGSSHLGQVPWGLIKQIVEDWRFDGGDRDYTGWNEVYSAAFRVRKAERIKEGLH